MGWPDNLPPQVHATITGPLVDWISLDLPDRLKQNPLARNGFLDVTLLGADPTGGKDSTKAIQSAINTARNLQLVCFFPSGTYIVSDTLNCEQQRYKRSSGKISSAPQFPNVLLGSRTGPRPKLILKRASPGFASKTSPKPVVHFWAQSVAAPEKPQPNISFLQTFTNIDIEIEPENDGAVALRHQAAQGSAIEECTLDVRNGFKGLEGGIGSGGAITDLTVLGGQVGLDFSSSQPVPTIIDVKLLGQTRAAIVYTGRQSLVCVGARIEYSGNGAAISGFPLLRYPFLGQIALIDSSIKLASKSAIPVDTQSSLYIKNTYIKNSGLRDILIKGPEPSSTTTVQWAHIVELVQKQRALEYRGNIYTSPVYVNGVQKKFPPVIGTVPDLPAGFLQLHHMPSPRPSFEDKGVADIMKDFGVKGDGLTDDTKALQAALNKTITVFLPKGVYKISAPLVIPKGVTLFGTATHLAVITPDPKGWRTKKGQPLLITAAGEDAAVKLFSFSLHTPDSIPQAYALRWQSGGESILHGVLPTPMPPLGGFKAGGKPTRTEPLVQATAGSGGRWYRLWITAPSSDAPGYAHLSMLGANRLTLYHYNTERASSPQQLKIEDCREVNIFGLKAEGGTTVVSINNSNNIGIYGLGGLVSATRNSSVITIKESKQIRLINLMESPSPDKKNAPLSSVPDWEYTANRGDWSFVHDTEKNADNSEQSVLTNKFERPAMYYRVE